VLLNLFLSLEKVLLNLFLSKEGAPEPLPL
jgi:hypothetical protein